MALRTPAPWIPTFILASGCYTGAAATEETAATGITSVGAPDEPELAATQPVGTSVLVEVRDRAGKPVPKAIVTLLTEDVPSLPARSHPLRAQLGSTTLAERPWRMTDGAGRVLLEQLPPGRILLRADAEGYTAGSAALELELDAHVGARITLLELGPRHAFEVAVGADIRQDQVRLRLPPGGVTDLAGNPITGLAEVTLTPLDPATMSGPSPWPLRGRREGDLDGAPLALLTSVYMVEISLWQGDQLLRLADGASADLEVLLPEDYNGEDATIPHWWYDYEAGAWQEETFGTVEPSSEHPGRLVWRKTLSHFSPQNLDVVCLVGCVNITVTDHNNLPVPNTKVIVEATNNGSAYVEGYTDNQGQVCLDRCTDVEATAYAGEYNQPTTPPVKVPAGGVVGHCGVECVSVELQFEPGEEPQCTPGEYLPCEYAYPEQEGIGQCQAGMNVCDGDGHWTGCAGEILPEPEACGTEIDEDCDGEPHDDEMSCTCNDGDKSVCYSGPTGTLNVGVCEAGERSCELVDQTWVFGACQGEALPAADPQEDCGTVDLDEDCDGNPACGDPQFGHVLGDGADQRARAVAVALNGDIYVAGWFSGKLDDGQILLLDAPPNAATHAFVVRYDAAGTPKAAGDLGDMTDLALEATASGVVVAGTVEGSVPLCGLVSPTADLAVLTLDAELAVCAVHQNPVLAGVQRATTIDSRGQDLFVGGLVAAGSALDFGPGDPVGQAADEGFVLKLVFDPNVLAYVPAWVAPLPRTLDPADPRAPSLAVAPAPGGVFATDVFSGDHVLAGSPLVANGSDDFYLVRLDEDGVPMWADGFGGVGSEPAQLAIAADSDGAAVLTGLVHGLSDLGGAQLVGAVDQTLAFLAKYDSDGTLLWDVTLPSEYPLAHACSRVTVDDADRITLAGSLSTPLAMNLKNGEIVQLDPINGSDAFVAKFSPTGIPYWGHLFGAPDTAQHAAAVAVTPTGSLVIVGEMSGDILEPPLNLDDPNDIRDAFLLKLDP